CDELAPSHCLPRGSDRASKTETSTLKGTGGEVWPMSALGQKRTCAVQKACPLYTRKRHQMRHMECPLWANSGHCTTIQSPHWRTLGQTPAPLSFLHTVAVTHQATGGDVLAIGARGCHPVMSR